MEKISLDGTAGAMGMKFGKFFVFWCRETKKRQNVRARNVS